MRQANPYQTPGTRLEDPNPGGDVVAAGRSTRFAAYLLDYLPLFLVGLVAALLIPALAVDRNVAGMLTVSIVTLLGILAFGIWQIYLLATRAQTFGKKVMGICMMRGDGTRPGFWRLFLLRYLPVGALGALAVMLTKENTAAWFISGLDALLIFTPTRQCGHDFLADTHVVRVPDWWE